MALTSTPSHPFLPFDLIHEILSRLPVKVLIQFQCICKSWKSLISDPKFTKKHLSLSTRHSLHCFQKKKERYNQRYINVWSYSFDSVSNNVITTEISQFHFNWDRDAYFVGSCNGILCLANERVGSTLIRLWNPSIGKFKKLPPLLEPEKFPQFMYGFGHDPNKDKYKVVVLPIFDDGKSGNIVQTNKGKVHTLGTDLWKSIPMFPFVGVLVQLYGQYVNGTTNWLAFKSMEYSKKHQYLIASFDLRNESYQEVLLPDYDEVDLNLSVFKDCLCINAGANIWIMKEYGNKESWTKLFTISYILNSFTLPSYSYLTAMYVFDDDPVLLKSIRNPTRKFIFYNLKNDTSKVIWFENIPEICIESLISPCF